MKLRFSLESLGYLSGVVKGFCRNARINDLNDRLTSVLSVDPTLELGRCRLPLEMALELFRPVVFTEILRRKWAKNRCEARRLLSRPEKSTLAVLEELIKDSPVIVSRPRSLERSSVLAFEPVIADQKSIGLHPLAIDLLGVQPGDCVTVSFPLSSEARDDAKTLMNPANNLRESANGRPALTPGFEARIGLFFLTLKNPGKPAHLAIFANPQEVFAALEENIVDIHTKIKARINGNLVSTTPGRLLVREKAGFDGADLCLDRTLDRRGLDCLLEKAFQTLDDEAIETLVQRLHELGVWFAERLGTSLSIDDLCVPLSKNEKVSKAFDRVREFQEYYRIDKISDGERYIWCIDAWADLAAEISEELFDGLSQKGRCLHLLNAVDAVEARSSVRKSLTTLAGMPGLFAKPNGEICETPVLSNLREGLSPYEFYMTAQQARSARVKEMSRNHESEALARSLHDALRNVAITEIDCGAVEGLDFGHLKGPVEIVEPLHKRIHGRVAVGDVIAPESGEILVRSGKAIEASDVSQLAFEDTRLTVRSPIFCQAENGGICAQCYGHDKYHDRMPAVGTAIGVVAAQSIASMSEQLVGRRYFAGSQIGCGEIAGSGICSAQNTGFVHFENLRSVRNKDGLQVVVNHTCLLTIVDEVGSCREEHWIRYGSLLSANEGQKIRRGDILAESDPFEEPIIAEVGGVVLWVDCIDGITTKTKIDEITGLSQSRVFNRTGGQIRPVVQIIDPRTKEIAKIPGSGRIAAYFVPEGAFLPVIEGETVYPGDKLVRVPRSLDTDYDRNAWRGITFINELLGIEKPRRPDFAVLADIDGTVTISNDKESRRLIVTPDRGEPREYRVRRHAYLCVRDGEHVRAGDMLVEGRLNPKDILRIFGRAKFARRFIDELQSIFALQNVHVAPIHLELALRHLLTVGL